jgi:hypothetical protein
MWPSMFLSLYYLVLLLQFQEAIGFFLPLAALQKPSFLPSASSSRRCATTSAAAANGSNNKYEYALLFDCDGVILETEELHRRAYNAAFQEFGLTIAGKPVEWSVRAFFGDGSVCRHRPGMMHMFPAVLSRAN